MRIYWMLTTIGFTISWNVFLSTIKAQAAFVYTFAWILVKSGCSLTYVKLLLNAVSSTWICCKDTGFYGVVKGKKFNLYPAVYSWPIQLTVLWLHQEMGIEKLFSWLNTAVRQRCLFFLLVSVCWITSGKHIDVPKNMIIRSLFL